MAYGLKVFDSAGRTVLDVVDRVPRIWTSTTISGSYLTAMSGFVSVPGMVRDGTWYVTASGLIVTGSYYIGGHPNCYCASGGFYWNATTSDSDGFNCNIYVYKL